MEIPGAGVLVGFEGVSEGEVDDWPFGARCSDVGGCERFEERRGNRLEVVEFAGYRDCFVVGRVDCFDEWIARRVFDEEIEKFGRQLRDKTARAHGVHGLRLGCVSRRWGK
jgi:hypothetical protein